MVRAALKEPVKTKAKTREVVFFRRAEWKNGQPQKQGTQNSCYSACTVHSKAFAAGVYLVNIAV